MKNKKLISIVVPVFNEEKNIPFFARELAGVLRGLENKYGFEIIFVNDGSSDGSSNIIEKLASSSERVKYLEFSRNFGKEIATSAGIRFAKGDAVIMLDADLQHPVDLIPEFIAKWQAGADIVIGIRKKNKGEGFVKKYGSILFYLVMNSIGDTDILPNSTDYRLLDRKVVEEFNRFTERNRITRGLIDWLGFRRSYVHFDAKGRNSGKARYGNLQLTRLALSTFVTHSLFPLKFAGYLGILITFFFGALGLFIFVEEYVLKDMDFSWPAILAVIILFTIGIVLICLGLIALYIGNIHSEVTNRPMYIIRKKKL